MSSENQPLVGGNKGYSYVDGGYVPQSSGAAAYAPSAGGFPYSGTAGSGIEMNKNNITGVFGQPSRAWNMTNLQFVHHFGGKEIKELAKRPHTEQPNRFPVPIEMVPDLTDFVYGGMPQGLTLRPRLSSACCKHEFEYDLARDLFANTVATVKVNFPLCICFWAGGMAQADVEVMSSVGGPAYKGVLKKAFCSGCCTNDTNLIWESMPNKPRMTYRLPSQLDTCKLYACQQIWIGWRGTSEQVPQNQVLFDNSLILSCSAICNACCTKCRTCQRSCCFEYDLAPRWVRPGDVRRLVRKKYDFEFSWRKLSDETDVQYFEGEDGRITFEDPLSGAHRVDALFSSRLYMDIQCSRRNVRWSNGGAANDIVAAVDARYRGSLDHASPTEDDHLIVLAGLIMHALMTFPNKDNRPMRRPWAQMFRGRLLPRLGDNVGSPYYSQEHAV